MNELIKNIEQWSIDRNINVGRPQDQLVKTMEELGEVANGISKNKPEMIKDGIGDTVVTLVCLAQRCGLDFEECVQTAYDEIKDRKGKMIDGVFVKEADLDGGFGSTGI